MLNSFEEYIEFYNKYGRCIDQVQRPKNKLNEIQLFRKWDNYKKKEERKEAKRADKQVDEKWLAVREEVFKRDDYQCQLYNKLNFAEKALFFNSNGYLTKTIDPAHVIPRSLSKNLYYDPDNIVTLDRIFHSRLDAFKHPLTGESIKKSDVEYWWVRIIGWELWTKLQQLK